VWVLPLAKEDTAPAAMTSKHDLTLGWFLIVLFCAVFLLLTWHTWAIDLTALYVAGHFFDTGQLDLIYLPGHGLVVYDPPPAYRALAEEFGGPTNAITPYLYPPLWAALLAPITRILGMYQFFSAFEIINIAALAATIWFSFRLTDLPTRMGFGRWALISIALAGGTGLGSFGIWLGQPQILVGFITLFAFYLFAEQRDVGAGAMLALAVAMKLSPVLLVMVFIMERRWRAVWAFAGVGLTLALLSITLAGWPLHAEMLHKLADISDHVLVYPTSAGLEMFLYQLDALIMGTEQWTVQSAHMQPEAGWISWVIRAILLSGLYLIWSSSRNLPERRRIWARFFTMMLLVILVNPLPWNHYLLLPLLMMPGLIAFMPSQRATYLSLAILVVLSLPVFLWMNAQPYLLFPQALLHLSTALGLFVLVIVLSRRSGKV
jgi:alpha-1,2-mannosyltransferase